MYKYPENNSFNINEFNDPSGYGLEYVIDELQPEYVPAARIEPTVDWFGLRDLTV